jgi:hypothetical protein
MRRFAKNKKGQIRTIEAFFASILLLSSLALISTTQKLNDSSTNALSSTALNTLVSLDNDGSLANLIDVRDWVTLRTRLQLIIPPALWFNLTVFDLNMTPINDILITSGSPISENIEVASYISASTGENYATYLLRLQISAVD